MELHKNTKIENIYDISINDDYLTYFGKAEKFVNDNYYETLKTIQNTKFGEVSPELFYRELVWVICASGFNSKVVSRFFPTLMHALSPVVAYIYGSDVYLPKFRDEALLVFGNKRKIDAMIECAKIIRAGIEKKTWAVYRDEELNTPEKLEKLPFIGGITKYHLARNIGNLDVMKPDLHLQRVSKHWGFNNPIELCEKIKETNDMPIGLIDLIYFYSLASFGSKI